MWLIYPDNYPPKWWAWYRPIRRHLCWLLKHLAEFTDTSSSPCRWCREYWDWADTKHWKGWAVEKFADDRNKGRGLDKPWQ